MAATGSFTPADQIVVPVQGTDREFLAQQWAVEMAAALGLPVRGIHISDGTSAASNDVFRYLSTQCRKHSVPFTQAVLHATDVVDELVNELGPRDLVVLGTRKLAHHFHVGSVAAALVEKAPCPVQIVRLE